MNQQDGIIQKARVASELGVVFCSKKKKVGLFTLVKYILQLDIPV